VWGRLLCESAPASGDNVNKLLFMEIPIVESLSKELARVVVFVIGYYTGVLLVLVLTWGRIRAAPIESMDSANPGKSRWTDWSVWLEEGHQGKSLKAEIVCLVGVAAWGAIIAWLFFVFHA